jgi:hypothetical protein
VSVVTSMPVSLFGLDPATYRPHALHHARQAYPETNCYVDVLVELLHAAGLQPLAVMACALTVDFEGDQFSFFKPDLEAVRELLGVEIHEMQPYRPLPTQFAEQLAVGRTLIVESDSWFLPDTAGTSYRQEHVKSSIALEAIDVDAERAHYFHNGGMFVMEGTDYRGALRVDIPAGDPLLPPYTELVRFDAGPALVGEPLRDASLKLLSDALRRRPTADPFRAYGVRLERELPLLVAGDADQVAAHVFATVRMAGAAACVGAAYAEWLFGTAAADGIAAFQRVADACKTMSFKFARRRAFEPQPLIDEAGASWAAALAGLDDLAR